MLVNPCKPAQMKEYFWNINIKQCKGNASIECLSIKVEPGSRPWLLLPNPAPINQGSELGSLNGFNMIFGTLNSAVDGENITSS